MFDDRNGNLSRDVGEDGLRGFVAYLDRNNNRRRDAGERSATTGSAGNYQFSNLAAGTHTVRVVVPSGFRQTKPPPDGGPHVVTLRPGQAATDRGFGVTRNAFVSGTVFRDRDRDGRLDNGEVGLGGRTVFLDADGDGRLDAGEAAATTDSRGRYTFRSARPGRVRVRLLLAGSVPTAPSGGVYNLTLANGQTLTGRNFGVR